MNDNEPNTFFGRAQAEAELMIGGRFGGSVTAPRDPAEGPPGPLPAWAQGPQPPNGPDPLGYAIDAVPQMLTVAPDGNEWLVPEPTPEHQPQPASDGLGTAPTKWRRR
jgi:hypothetical protein